MSAVFKVAAAGIVTAVCAVVLRKQTPELAVLLSISGGMILLLYCTGALENLMRFISRLTAVGGVSSEVMGPVLRVTGIAALSKLSGDFCRDAGESGVASAVELAGSILSLLALVPLMSMVLGLIEGLL